MSSNTTWAFVDRYDDDGNLVGDFAMIEEAPRPFAGPDSWGERKRRQRVGFRMTIADMATSLGITPVEVSGVEMGRIEANADLRHRWNDVLLLRAVRIIVGDGDDD